MPPLGPNLRHLAIIMDGNGRWAKARHHSRIFGHVRGAKVARQVIEKCAMEKLEYLTLYAFSTENWQRPPLEVRFLMNLLRKQLARERGTLLRNNVRFRVIGQLERVPEAVRETIEEIVVATQDNSGMTLTIALSYGGRQELAEMARELCAQVVRGQIIPEQIDEDAVAKALPSSFLPDPDLILRTSGEARISNFFLWQAAYSEIEFEPKPWPEFTLEDLERILGRFCSRERRFGRVSEQLRPG